MEFFRNAKTVRLKSCHGNYLCARNDGGISALSSESLERRAARGAETRRGDWWSVEFVVNSDSDSVLRLKSSFGKYLGASDQRCFRMGGGKVVQSPPSLDSSLEWKPVMVGTQVKLRTHYGSFLNAKDCGGGITHDISHNNTILWDVEIVEREQEGSATNVDDKALEEGSATKRRHETGEGSSVAKNPKGDSGLIRKYDRVKYRRHFWNLKIKLWDKSGRTDVLVSGGSGTTALVREVCLDVGEQFDTIVWIGIPQKNDSALITEEMLLQLIFERMAFPECFDGNPWMLVDSEFSLEQKPRCLVVVDNLDDPRTCKKFEEILRKVKTCSVIFIARREMDKLSSLLKQYGRESDPHKYVVKDLSFVPWKDDLKSFLEKTSTSPSKGVCQLIVKKCERLPTAIVFVLPKQEGYWLIDPDKIIVNWEATIPSDDCRCELDHLQRALKICNQKEEQALETNYDDEDRRVKKVLEILSKDDLDLRFCFLYLIMLPPNSPISCQRVTRLWAAQSCLTDMGRAEQFFKDLLQEKLIYPEERRRDGELSSFRVDNGVRDIIASLSNLNLSYLVSTTSLGGTYWPKKVEYLSVQGTIGPLYEEKSFELSQISALDVSIGEDRRTTFEASPLETYETPSSSSSLKHSKVLDLTDAPFPVVPFKLFEQTDVRYLSLRNTSISVIPRSIRKLRHLEFLDAKQSLVTKLPWQVARLKKLRHILIYHHEKDPLMESYNLIGFKALCRLGRFECLEKLCFVEADEETLGDIGNLTKLMRLGITELREEHGELLCSSLEKLWRLESLNLHASDEDEIIDLHHLTRPRKSLKRLYLHCRLNKLPDWISELVCLTKIVLRWSNLEAAIEEKEDLLATLGKLPELVELELRRAYNGTQLDFKDGQFPKLKILLLDELGRLSSMSLAKRTMPSLEDLTISRCPGLEGMPTGIEDIPELEVEFFESTCLKYLRLRDTKIEVIPKSIKRLEHLEFLELKQNSVTELPREAEGLQRLRHILIYHHEKDPLMESYNLIGFKALCSVGQFKWLEKLCFVEADGETLGDIGNLTQLMRLGITELREEHGKLLCSSLEELERLESLNLHASDEDEIIDLHHMSRPPTSLKRLYLHCRLKKLPDWISSLCHLTKIVLRWSYLKEATQQEEDLLATLGKLPELVELELRRAYNGRQLDFKYGQFPKLKKLLLDELGRLRSVSLAKGTMPSLEDLTISRCPWLEGMPTGIEDIPKLEALEFFDMSPEFNKSVSKDHRYSGLKEKVYFTQWRPGQWKTIPLGGVDKRDEASQVNTESRLLRVSE